MLVQPDRLALWGPKVSMADPERTGETVFRRPRSFAWCVQR
jgi:hypothetical protein